VTGTPFFLQFYSGERAKFSLTDAVKNTVNYGLAYYEKFRKPMTSDASELAKAFAYFNDAVDLNKIKANQSDATKKIRDGVHPVAQQALTKVGSYMAAKLAEKHGIARLETYAGLGGLAFVEDYAVLANSDASIAKDLQPSEELRTTLAELATDWRRTNTEYVRRLAIGSGTDVDAVGKNLRETFKGASIYPNVVDSLFEATRQAVVSKDPARALKVARLSFELYPESHGANLGYGLTLVLTGDSANGLARLRKAREINPNGGASAGGLNNIAYQLGNGGMVDEAIIVLRAGIELYPQEANLYDSLGEFQLRKGDKVSALASYQKALELNPNFPNAATARDIVKKLSEELAQKN
jgi:tetratricopeptide (TPR) repeat protein